MATQGHITEFNLTFENWKKINFTQVYREELGTASFKHVKPLIDDLENKLLRIETIKDSIGDNLLAQIYGTYNSIITQLNSLIEYDETQFVSYKSTVEGSIRALNEELLNWWPQILALLNDNSQNTNVDELINQIKSLSEKSEKDANIIENLKTKLTSDLNTFESRYKDQFTRAELMKQQDIFSIQASDYKTKADFWSKLIIATSLILVIALWIVFKNFCFELSCFDKICDVNYDSLAKGANEKILYLEIFKSVAYRLFIISFILYLINFCVKNFNASMHNYTVNSHKANSLSAAIILIDRARTDEGNDNIMTQAANSIFSHQPTGYNNKNPENLQTSLSEKIIDKINPLSKG